MIKWISHTRLWLLVYLLIQAILFYQYSFPYLRDFQRSYSSLFFISITILSAISPRKYLLYIIIIVSILIDPLYTFSVLTIQTRYKLLVTIGLMALIIYKRSELRLVLIVLLLANTFLFISQKVKIASIDRDFRERSYPTNDKNPLQLRVDSTISAGNNIYVIILDGYPSFEILKDSFNYESRLKLYLDSNQFKALPTFTIYKSTPLSLLHIFSSRKIRGEPYPEFLETNRNFFAASLYNSAMVKNLKANNYKFSFFSSILNKQSWAAPVSLYPKYSINDLDIFIYRHLTKKAKVQKYNYATIPVSVIRMNNLLSRSLSDSSKKMAVFHYYTFHNNTQPMIEETRFADEVGIKAVGDILDKDPDATIIVMSDHGERRHITDKELVHHGIFIVRRGY